MPEISIIVRTKNEERWIGHCLSMIFNQSFKDFEVILVDNNSEDHTVEVAKRYPLAKILTIEKFIPGKALNDGIRASSGHFIVCLSAHCIPKDEQWLSNLRQNFNGDEKLAGVYGRQLPVSFTEAVDKRDLMITFGMDRRKQIKDYFFHNANSILPRNIWEKFPFDEEVTNIEDRVWGKNVVDAGYHIIYDPEPALYHHHGLHQNNSKVRAKGVVSIIEQVHGDTVNELPESLRPETINIVAILLVQNTPDKNTLEYQLLSKVVDELKLSKYICDIFIVSQNEKIAIDLGGIWVNRKELASYDEDTSVDILLSKALNVVEDRKCFPEAVLYVNHHYPYRPQGLFDDLIVDAQYKGYDCVFPGFVDYGHYWYDSEINGFKQLDSSMESRSKRDPMFRALYGLGCVVSTAVLRNQKIVGGEIGILPVEDFRYTLNIREKGVDKMIRDNSCDNG